MQHIAIRKIPLKKGCARIDRLAMALAEIVKDGHLKSAVQELLNTNAANVAGTARDKNFLHFPVSISVDAPQSSPQPASSDPFGDQMLNQG
jgi:hypothetical protein